MGTMFALWFVLPFCQVGTNEAGLPPVDVSDLPRFAAAAAAIEKGFNHAAIERYREALEARRGLQAGWQDEYEEELQRVRFAGRAFELLEEALRSDEGEWCQTNKLDELKWLIGAEAYEAGAMPAFPPAAFQFVNPRPFPPPEPERLPMPPQS